ncbi:MAG: hypothetical protein A3C11_01905 [Candidatus Sungbacteria bacterium RIFCSPHIGHO2_02_FULL_49_12]|uniref:Uncharacterized protein n=1 Tax=Candidatus Sungbacteria bacterium RIFCSPHIGHO2_02_FULL_49_12 TaxID=1802271 RepID=A0A1G2KMI6_9BACT|nr:MAG: hypothetical protein A3C11_01905 [Candidatus Sungbacteria bacterium RIFCSPHIGHO2_02_FULL_49_12]
MTMDTIRRLIQLVPTWHLVELSALRFNAIWLMIFALLPLPVCMIWGDEIGKKWPVAIGDLIAIAGILYYGVRRVAIVVEITAILRKLAVNTEIAASIIWAVGAFIEAVTWVLKSVPTIGLLALLLPVERDPAWAILAGVAGIIFAASAISKQSPSVKWDMICNISAAFTLLISLFIMAFPSDEEWGRVGVKFAAEAFWAHYGGIIRFAGVGLMAIIAAYFCLRGKGGRSVNPTRAAGVSRPAAKKEGAGGFMQLLAVLSSFLAGATMIYVLVMTIIGGDVPWGSYPANAGHVLLTAVVGIVISWLFGEVGKTQGAWGVFASALIIAFLIMLTGPVIIHGNPNVKAAFHAAHIGRL